jgi:hypothetical protein
MQLSVSELVGFLASADADAAASYMLRELAEPDPELVETERSLVGRPIWKSAKRFFLNVSGRSGVATTR